MSILGLPEEIRELSSREATDTNTCSGSGLLEKGLYLWTGFKEALKAFLPIPTWPF
jgi:hypothetical protein